MENLIKLQKVTGIRNQARPTLAILPANIEMNSTTDIAICLHDLHYRDMYIRI